MTRKLLTILLAFLLIAPSVSYGAVAVFYPVTSSTGQMASGPNGAYLTSHDLTSAGNFIINNSPSECTQNETTGGNFFVSRNAVTFDTRTLAGATIATATISYYGNGSHRTGAGSNLVVVDFTPQSTSTLQASDFWYQRFGNSATSTMASMANTSWTNAPAYNDFPLNSTGTTYINKTGWTSFGLRSSLDISATAPVGLTDETQCDAQWTPTSTAIMLSVTYTPAATPSVGTTLRRIITSFIQML